MSEMPIHSRGEGECAQVEVDEKVLAAVGSGPRRHQAEPAPSQPVLLVGPESAFERSGISD